MGCCGGSVGSLPDGGVSEIIEEVGTKLIEIEAEFSDVEILSRKEKTLIARHDELVAAFAAKIKEEKLTDLIKELNGKDLEIDNELIMNQLNKMKKMYEIALEYAEKLRAKLLAELEKKVQNAPGAALIKRQIDRIKQLPTNEFLDSEYAKPLKDFLEKQGLSESVLESYIQKLTKERAERRKKEREEFGIAVNEYPDEELYDALKEDLYKEMMEETAKTFASKIVK